MGGLPWMQNGKTTPPAAMPAAGGHPVAPTTAPASPITQDHPLTIVRLTAENVKRLRAVSIAPDGNLVVLSGRNGQGKTSVLDAIAFALGGKDELCPEPVRRGADTAEIVCDLGDLVVRRRFIAGGGTTVEVSTREGLRYPSPQKILDELVGKLTFDPLAFARQAPKEQQETLRALLGLDFTDDDARHDALYEERTMVNRELKAAQAKLQGLVEHQGVPDTPLAASDIAAQIQAANAKNNAVRLRNERLAAIDARAKALQAELEQLGAEWQTLNATDATTIEVAPLVARLAEIDTVNAKVRSNQKRAEFATEVEAKKSRSDELTQQINAIKASKSERIAAAKMPIAGLGFGETGVTLNGLPLEQGSGAEQLRVSVAIGIAMNPRLRVLLVRDASLLDQDSLHLVAKMAQEAGAQVWLETVATSEQTSVVIEDGQVVQLAPTAGATDG